MPARMPARVSYFSGTRVRNRYLILQGVSGVTGPYYYPWQFPVTSYGAVGDGQMQVDAAMDGSTGIVTCATSTPFKPSDVNKYMIVNGALGTGNALVGQVASWQSTSQVTLNVNSTTAVTGACVLWGTDDTSPFQAAINAASTYMQTGFNAEVYRPYPPNGLFYMIAGPLVNAGDANSQLTIPNPSATAPKQVLRFYADIQSGTALPLWTQTAYAQVPGSVVSAGLFASTLAYFDNFSTFGAASVLGSTPSYAGLLPPVGGLPAFANIHVVCENWTTVCPSSSNGLQYTAISLQGCATGEIRDCGALITTNYNTSSGANQFPSTGSLTNGYSTGFILPANGNNDQALCTNPTVSGFRVAIQCAEHALIYGGRLIFCQYAFQLSGQDTTAPNAHLTRIIACSVEGCRLGFYVLNGGLSGVGFFVDAEIDVEQMLDLIQDNDSGTGINTLYGEIRVYGNYNMSIFDPGYPIRVKLLSIGHTQSGWIFSYTGFSTAGTTVPVLNPYWRDARVYYTGGTVTAVSAGQTIGGTSGSIATPPSMTQVTTASSGVIDWPSGGWLSFTFTGSPAWDVMVS
jgi:hypothetical protein